VNHDARNNDAAPPPDRIVVVPGPKGELSKSLAVELVFSAESTFAKPIRTPPIPFVVLYNVYRLVNRSALQFETAYHIAQFGAWIATHGQAPFEDLAYLARVLLSMRNTVFYPIDIILEDDEEALISLTYLLLRSRSMTHAEAAQAASEILGKPVSANTWERRVARWAKRKGLPRIGQRQPRRPSATDKRVA
jgi:hypothetical protein